MNLALRVAPFSRLAAQAQVGFHSDMTHLQTLVVALLLLTGGQLHADGKMYAEKVNTEIPYQRALILFDEGNQTMVLQSQYQIPNEPGDHTLGWVVPVPAVPEIFSMDAGEADDMFSILSRYSRPEQVHLFGYLILVVVVLGVGCFITSFLPSPSNRKSLLRKAAFLSISIAVFSFVFALLTTKAGRKSSGVEIVQAGKVGIYDTKVVKAESAQDLIEWFNEHSFRFNETDAETIQSYIDREWCFVTATVDASVSSKDRSAVSSNLLAPLILHFPTPTPVYPTELTATGGHPTEILIYLVSRAPMKTTPDLTLRFSGPFDSRSSLVSLVVSLHDAGFGVDSTPFQLLGSDDVHLQKFKATLTPEQMAEDIEFLPDPGAKPHWKTWFGS